MLKMNEVSFDIPRYYDIDFKGRKPKHCPDCGSKMKYDGWSSDGVRIDEWWQCKRCNKMIKNPES